MGLQFNRVTVRQALTRLFTGDPKEHSDLRAVLLEMGLSGEKPILHETHPVVVEAARLSPGEPFVLAPAKASTLSSVLRREGEAIPKVFEDFASLLGMSDYAFSALRLIHVNTS